MAKCIREGPIFSLPPIPDEMLRDEAKPEHLDQAAMWPGWAPLCEYEDHNWDHTCSYGDPDNCVDRCLRCGIEVRGRG